MGEDVPAPRHTLAEKLNHLFSTVHPRRGEYSSEEVARAIEARGGPSISGTYIWMLRRGQRDNPTKKHLEALASFFGVSPAYFFDDEVAERVQAQLGLLAELRDSPIRRLALRTRGISPQALNGLTEIIDRVRELEGLPPDAEEDPLAELPSRSTAPDEKPGAST